MRVRKDKFGEIFINSIKSGQTSIEEIAPFTDELAQITTTLENPSVTEAKMNVVAIQSLTRSLVCLSCRKRAVPTRSGKPAICENKSCRTNTSPARISNAQTTVQLIFCHFCPCCVKYLQMVSSLNAMLQHSLPTSFSKCILILFWECSIELNILLSGNNHLDGIMSSL